VSCIKEKALSEGFLLVPLEAELIGVYKAEGRAEFLIPNPPPGWTKQISIVCPKRRRFLAALNQLLEESEQRRARLTLLIWPRSNEEGEWVPPDGDSCWALCFERGLRPPPPNKLKIRLTGQLLRLDSERRLIKVELSNGGLLTAEATGSAPKKLRSNEIVVLELDADALYANGKIKGKIRTAKGKLRLEHLRIRSLFERLDPAIKIEGEESFAINYGDIVLLYGEAKVGKTRAALALFADGKPTKKAKMDIIRHINIIGNPLIYYLSHVTETALPLLREYAVSHGWNEERAEDNLYPFQNLDDVREFLKDIPEQSIVVVDSLVKLIPPGKSENDALHVEEALSPIISAAREKKHVLFVIHHTKKNQLTFRGSTAIEALPDHIIQANRPRSGPGKLIIKYVKGRSVPPQQPLLEIIDLHTKAEETRASKENTATPRQKKRGARPKYVNEVLHALQEVAKADANKKTCVEEEKLVQVLKSKFLKKHDTKEIKKILKRYSGMGENSMKAPVLKVIKEGGKVCYAALLEKADSSSEEIVAKRSGGKNSTRRARVKAT